MPKIEEVESILSRYLLLNDVRESTAKQYRAIVKLFVAWCSQSGESEFSADTISRFLLHKQEVGRSSHYRASLRNTLRVILRFSGSNDKIRKIKLSVLSPESWTPAEVGRLIFACEGNMPPASKAYWQSLIAAAWHTGLSHSDLRRIKKSDIGRDGTLEIARSKTGKIAFVQIPLEVLAQAQPHPDGRLWPLLTSAEWFRRTFQRIVKIAGLRGSFKKLRKSSGTWAEIISPGRGHEHLANSREIFERHYADRRRLSRTPVAIPPLLSHEVAHVAESLN